VFDGCPLEVEDGNPEVTIRNIDKIVTGVPRRRIAGLVAGPHGNVLVVLSTGELYMATGFGLQSSSKRDALAFYLANIEDHD